MPEREAEIALQHMKELQEQWVQDNFESAPRNLQRSVDHKQFDDLEPSMNLIKTPEETHLVLETHLIGRRTESVLKR